MKFTFLILGLVVVVLGLLPLLVDFLPEALSDVIPTEGMTYNILIALVGCLIVYLSLERKGKGLGFSSFK